MKIAVIGIEKIPTDLVKAERHYQELYTRIAARGHEVDIFALSKQKQMSLFSVNYYKNIRIITLFSASSKHTFVLFNLLLNTIWVTLGNYDVVHIYGIKNAVFAWLPNLLTMSKIVLTCNQLNYQQYRRHKIFVACWCWIEKRIMRNADEIIVDSKALATYFLEHYNIHTHHVPNAPRSYLPTDCTFSYGKALGLHSQKYILCLGKLEPDCKPHLVVKAFQKLQPNDWKLVFIGDIGDYPEYASKVIAEGQKNNIMFVSDTRGYSLAEIVNGAGLLIAPSAATDLKSPLIILEAMREGVPIIASDIAVNQEIIGKDRGLLFVSGKSESLYRQLEYALSEPEILQTIVKKAQTYTAIHHNWDRVVYKNLFLYLKTNPNPSNQHKKCRTLDS